MDRERVEPAELLVREGEQEPAHPLEVGDGRPPRCARRPGFVSSSTWNGRNATGTGSALVSRSRARGRAAARCPCRLRAPRGGRRSRTAAGAGAAPPCLLLAARRTARPVRRRCRDRAAPGGRGGSAPHTPLERCACVGVDRERPDAGDTEARAGRGPLRCRRRRVRPRRRRVAGGRGSKSRAVRSFVIGAPRPLRAVGSPRLGRASPSRRWVRAGGDLVEAAADVLPDGGADGVVDAHGVSFSDELLEPAVVLSRELDDDLADVLGGEVEFDVLLETFADRVGDRRRPLAHVLDHASASR